MEYVMIGLILLFGTLKGYAGKKTSGYIREVADAFLFTFWRMLLCVLIGLILVIADGACGFLRLDGGMLAICAFSGVANAAFLTGWILAVRKNTMVSMDVGLTLGSLIPAVACAILFAEPISIPKMFGFGLIVIATVVLAGYNKQVVRGGVLGVILLLIAMAGDGFSGVAQQLYKHYYTEAGSQVQGIIYPKTVYHFYTYVFSAIVLMAILLITHLWNAGRGRKSGASQRKTVSLRVPAKALLHIAIMAVCLFAVNYFQTVATNDYGMPSQVLYPIVKGGGLITVNFTAMIFFGERITLRSVCGSLLALAGMVSMSLL